MHVTDLLARTRDGRELTAEEIDYLVLGYTRGEVPDYQIAAWLMAVVLKGLTPRETVSLTETMVRSGRTLDWPASLGPIADKHSTGGVGDKTSLVVVPLVAAAGLPMAKMSGRGLGHTGGTIDKLESIPGFRVDQTVADFQAQVERIGLAIVAQSQDLAPADGKLYALRDVTATVESLPLIASSIMSKKIAAGARAIVLDVKVGGGGLIPTLAEARALSRTMIALGAASGRKVRAVLSAMDQPLGLAVGHALEVAEALSTLRREGPPDLTELAIALSAQLLVLANRAPDMDSARAAVEAIVASGAGLAKFRLMVEAQGGMARVVDDPSALPRAPVVRVALADRRGFVAGVDARAVGEAVMALGGGRAKKGDPIDHAVGIVLRAKRGTAVRPGAPLFEVHARAEADARCAEGVVADAFTYAEGAPPERPLVLEVLA